MTAAGTKMTTEVPHVPAAVKAGGADGPRWTWYHGDPGHSNRSPQSRSTAVVQEQKSPAVREEGT